ncbi:serine/threonine-protein kinase [Streptomyces sp. ST2-7A]|uniref:serine/threonine-protein kinase n=1 Tax=Streptomyces sp. ST2-7A TaxID=2907214 RepID=UPI001F3D62AB|nr:serine/threonine-protein kinase [Streptomyces sp. ST2-7A]MCE7080862.1 serine/threonine protein kinase [Streptomyces sp. ST2-7A]
MEPDTGDEPRRAGPHLLLRRLGSGGMGGVYLARSRDGRAVAVKLIHRRFADRPEFRERFRREVAAARRVGGRWIAPVLDADTEAEVPWVASEYVPGPTLREVVAGPHGPLPAGAVLTLADGLARALRDIHAAGLVHRDLKPSNVLLTAEGPRVIDFGIARAVGTPAGEATGEVLTDTGAVIGSPGFMSPEQCRGERPGPASDVFCLGSVLAFAATGQGPFGPASASTPLLMLRVLRDEKDLAGVPEGVREPVESCLAPDPADRPTPEEITALTDRGGLWEPGGGPWLPEPFLSEVRRAADEPAGEPAGKPAVPAPVPVPPMPPHAPGAFGAAPHPAYAPWTPAPGSAGAPAPASAPVPGGSGGARRPWPVLLGAVAAVTLLVVGAALLPGLLWESGSSGTPAGSGGVPSDHVDGPDAGATTEPVPDGGDDDPGEGDDGEEAGHMVTLPAGMLGARQGTTADDAEGDGTVRLELAPDGTRRSVGTVWIAGARTLCVGDLRPTGVTDGDATLEVETTFTERLPETGCPPDGPYTVTAGGNGTLTWRGPDDGPGVVLSPAPDAGSEEAVPAALLGTWGHDEPDAEHRLTVEQGPVGEPLLTWGEGGPDYRCASELTLIAVSADGGEAVFGPSAVREADPKTACSDAHLPSVRLTADGELMTLYRADGGEPWPFLLMP